MLLFSFALGALLEGFAAFELLTSATFPNQPVQAVLLSHLAACGLLVPALLFLLPPTYRKDKWLSILLILGLSAPLPVVGAALVLLFSQYILKLELPHKPESDFYFGDRRYSSGNEQSCGNSLTRSIIVHLRSPDVEVRRNAILAVKQLDFKAAIPILGVALQDSDEQVRIYARNTWSQIAGALEGSLKEIESADITSPQRLDRVIFVAEHFRHYLELGLIAEGSRKPHLDEVIRLLSESLAAETDNERILCLLLKFCLLTRDIRQAKTHLIALKQLAPSPDVTLPWELEIYFEDHDWSSLSALLTTIRRSHFQNPQVMKSYNFWHQKSSATR